MCVVDGRMKADVFCIIISNGNSIRVLLLDGAMRCNILLERMSIERRERGERKREGRGKREEGKREERKGKVVFTLKVMMKDIL